MITSIGRYAYLVLSALFLAGVVVQTFFAGLGIFGDPGAFEVHIALGWVGLHLAPLLILIAGAVGRVGRRNLLLTAALAVVTFVQPLLPGLREAVPAAAALHPVNALLIFWLTILVVRAAVPMVGRARQPEPEPAAASAS